MATNLAGGVCIGHYDVCLVRVGRLDALCAPVYGADNGVISSAIVSLTAGPEIEAGAEVLQKNGCGAILINVKKQDKIKRRNLTGVIGLHDYEMFELMFGGGLLTGAAGTPWAGEVSGYAEPGPDSDDRNPISFEVVVRNAIQGQGQCQAAGETSPSYTGYIFPKAFLTRGDVEIVEGIQVVNFTGTSEPNPAYFTGPFRDWDDYAAETFPDYSSMVEIGYDELPLAGIVGAPDCGYQTTPASS